MAASLFRTPEDGARMTAVDPNAMQRCCRAHQSWQELTEHLLDDYAELDADQVVDQLVRARSAVQTFGIDKPEQIEMVEVLARHQLMLLTGEVPDAARLDPEVHVRHAQPQRLH